MKSGRKEQKTERNNQERSFFEDLKNREWSARGIKDVHGIKIKDEHQKGRIVKHRETLSADAIKQYVISAEMEAGDFIGWLQSQVNNRSIALENDNLIALAAFHQNQKWSRSPLKHLWDYQQIKNANVRREKVNACNCKSLREEKELGFDATAILFEKIIFIDIIHT